MCKLNNIEKIRADNIFKSIKYHMNELKRLRPDYEIVMVACQGSQNYNLDLYTENYKSDIDTIAVVLPSFSDFVNNEHIDVKDIRLLFELFKKQNIKYLEILFTQYKIINKNYRKIIDRLLKEKENIAHYDIDRLIRTTFGMQQEKYKALEHPYEGLKDKIEKYGYDGKQLHHIIRLALFLQEYCITNSFEEALNSNNYSYEGYDLLLSAKTNSFLLESARDLSKKYLEKLSGVRNLYEGNLKYPLTINVDDFLNEIKSDIFNKYFIGMFTPKIEQKVVKQDTLPDLSRIFVTSDLHFGHENILSFEPKRWNMMGIDRIKATSKYILDNNLEIPQLNKDFKEKWDDIDKEVNHLYIKQHDEELIKRWNSKVSNKDTVYILGDLSFYSGPKTNEILKRLNGNKILIKGNHDSMFLNDKKFDTSLLKEIVNYKEIRLGKYIFILFHFPIAVWNLIHKGAIHLFGHIHSNETTVHPLKEIQENSYNVGVDANNYYPVPITDYINKTKKVS